MEKINIVPNESIDISASLTQQFNEIESINDLSTEKIEKLVYTIVSDLNLLKVLEKDLKKRKIEIITDKEDYVIKISNIFLNTYCINPEQLNMIKVKLLKSAETNNPFNLQKKEGINNIIDCLQPAFLQQSTSKNCKAISKMITLIKAIDNQKNEQNEGYIENLKQSLQVWALQYLSKLEKREKNDPPLTVIIDTSTTFFTTEEIKQIVTQFDQQIEKGKINLVLINSLAKFAMCGLDKYTGGLIQTFSCLDEMNIQLNETTGKALPSEEAKKFFLLFIENHKLIETYLQQLNKNTNQMYLKLIGLNNQEGNPIQIGKREENIPMIGIHFKNMLKTLPERKIEKEELKKLLEVTQTASLACIMQYFLAAKALHKNLPVSIRSSFGFSSINFIECGTALRMTIGLEEENILDQVAEVILRENEAFDKDFESLEKEEQNVINFVLDDEDSLLSDLLEKKISL